MPSNPFPVRMKTCPSCSTPRPEFEYKLAQAAGFRCCDICLPDAEHARSLERRQIDAKRRFIGLMRQYDIPNLKRPPKMDEMLSALMDEFEGPQAFVHELASQMKQMAVNKSGHPETVRLFQAVLKLVHENNKRQDQADANALTLEQVDQATEVALFSFMAEAALNKGKAKLLFELLQPAMKEVEALQPDPTPEIIEEVGHAEAAN